MRQVADIAGPTGDVRRVMVYATADQGVYLFLYESMSDGPCDADLWFESATDAIEAARREYGISPGDWRPIPDPRLGCQHDWIAPTRVKRGPDGQPLWGQFVSLPG